MLRIILALAFGLVAMFLCVSTTAVPDSGASTLAFILAVAGGLLFLWGNRARRNQREERRHQELIQAMRETKPE